MRCCGNCEYVKVTKSLLDSTVLPVGMCKVKPPQWIPIKSAWLYPEVDIQCQPCGWYKMKGE